MNYENMDRKELIEELHRRDSILGQLQKIPNELVSEILEHITDGFFILDNKLHVLYFNTAAEALLQRSRTDVLGYPLFDRFPEARGSIFEEQYRKALQEERFLNFEVYFDREPYINWYNVRVYPINQGIMVMFVVSTEQKQREQEFEHMNHTLEALNQELEEANAELESTNEELETNNQELRLSYDQILKSEQLLEESLKEKEILLKEVHHRVKNNLNTVIALLYLQSAKIKETRVKEQLGDITNRIMSMSLIHEMLYKHNDFTRVSIPEYVHELCNYLKTVFQDCCNRIHIQKDLPQLFLTINQAVPCGLIMNEILTNAYKHAFPDNQTGSIYIRGESREHEKRIFIGDNGVGIPEAEDLSVNNSLGIQLIHTLVQQFGGSITYTCKDGTHYELTIPDE